MARTAKLSGLQKQVLGLYRGFLRAARGKTPEQRHRIELVVSSEFRNNARTVDRKNFLHIEYLLRRGKKQLEQLKCVDTIGLSTLKVTQELISIFRYSSLLLTKVTPTLSENALSQAKDRIPDPTSANSHS